MSLNGKGINEMNELDCLRELVVSAGDDAAAEAGDATAGNQTTEIARLDSILAKIIAAPATEAKQDTQVTAEQAILATAGATNGAAVITDANGTLQQYLRGIVKLLITSGTIILGAGTNAIGKLAANSGVDIGDVDVTSLPSVGYSASASFTPAAASHTAGDVNGAAGTFASMGPSAGRIIITSASLEIDGASAEATAWRLYLFNITPPSAVADDGAFVLPSGDRASFLGQVDLGTAVDLVDTQYVEVNGINKQVKLAGTSLFAYLVNLTTLTPAAVAHIVTLHAVGV